MIPANIYLLKINNRRTRIKSEICSKLTIKTPEWRQRRRNFLVKPDWHSKCEQNRIDKFVKSIKRSFIWFHKLNFISSYLLDLKFSNFQFSLIHITPTGIFLLNVNNRNTSTRCEICSKLTIKTPERCQWRRSGVFIVNFGHISHLVIVFLLLTLNI